MTLLRSVFVFRFRFRFIFVNGHDLTHLLLTELFLYGFIVPILPYMLQTRIGVKKRETQSITSNLLGIFAGIQILMAPVIGILADRTPRRKTLLLFGLCVALSGTILMAMTLQCNHIKLL